MLELLLIVLLVLALLGGVPAWRGRADYGYGPSGVVGFIVLIILVVLLLRVL